MTRRGSNLRSLDFKRYTVTTRPGANTMNALRKNISFFLGNFQSLLRIFEFFCKNLAFFRKKIVS